MYDLFGAYEYVIDYGTISRIRFSESREIQSWNPQTDNPNLLPQMPKILQVNFPKPISQKTSNNSQLHAKDIKLCPPKIETRNR